MSGLYSSHPNNVDYLLKKNRLQIKDIRYILSIIEPEKRKRYDYDNIDRIYLEYSSSKYDDKDNLQRLKETTYNKPVVIVVFGATSRDYSDSIVQFIMENDPVTISVNHIYSAYLPDFVFYGNQRRYINNLHNDTKVRRIITSNISSHDGNDIVVDYSKVISLGCANYDNTSIMLLNLLRNIGVKNIAIAGLDGYSGELYQTFSDEIYSHDSQQQYENNYEIWNEELKLLLRNYANSISDKHSVRFLTPSRFQTIFED